MYYEPYKRKQKHRKRRDRHRRRGGLIKPLFKLLVFLLVLLTAGIGLLYIMPAGLFAIEPKTDLSLNSALPSSPINILLLGLDAENEGLRRSDTMIIASIGPDGVHLVSLLRDMTVDIPGIGPGRINSAYAYGGAELALRTVNASFGLNIMHYIAADYTSLVRLVDAVGGIEVDVTPEEMEQINVNLRSVERRFRRLGYACAPLTVSGAQTHLDGLQALGYARIRKLDSDFMRASRQRTVLFAALSKLQSSLYNPLLVARTARAALLALDTDLNAVQLLSLGVKAVAAGEVKALRVPVNDSFSDTGAAILLTDLEMNVQAIHGFLYESTDK